MVASFLLLLVIAGSISWLLYVTVGKKCLNIITKGTSSSPIALQDKAQQLKECSKQIHDVSREIVLTEGLKAARKKLREKQDQLDKI